jgi:F-type H+-transporting ATPase subunit delta
MLDKTLAVRYAQALYDAAANKGVLPAVLSDVAAVKQTIATDSTLRNVLFHPAIPAAEKKQLAKEIWGGSVSAICITFLYILFDAKRINYLDLIYETLSNLCDRQKNIIKARATTVFPLSPETVAKLKQALSKVMGKDVELSTDTSPEILGGIKLTIGDKVIDGSVAYNLKKLEEKVVF